VPTLVGRLSCNEYFWGRGPSESVIVAIDMGQRYSASLADEPPTKSPSPA